MTTKVNRSKFHKRVFLGDRFGFADHQVKATYGLGLEYKLYRNFDSVILGRNAATAGRETTIHAIYWFVRHCTPNESQQDLMNVYVVFKIPSEIPYIKRSFSDKLVYQSECDFELGANSEAGIPVLFSLRFQP